jgi:hypothetical protein
MRDKRQRLAPERFLDEGGIDIGDPVAEAFIGSRAAVMLKLNTCFYQPIEPTL